MGWFLTGPASRAGPDAIVTQGGKAHSKPPSRCAGNEGISQRIADPVGPWAAKQGQTLSHSANSPQKGLLCRSSPIVVAGPWPG